MMRIGPAPGRKKKAGRPPAPPSRRQGATAMEYLVVITFILVALIMAVQYFGVFTGGLFSRNANATDFNKAKSGP